MQIALFIGDFTAYDCYTRYDIIFDNGYNGDGQTDAC